MRFRPRWGWRGAKGRGRGGRRGHRSLPIHLENEQERRGVHLGIVRADDHGRPAEPSHHRDILLPVHLVRDRRCHAGTAELELKQLVALIGAVREQAAIIDHLEDQVAGGRDGASADTASARRAPNQFLVDGIPGFKDSPIGSQRLRPDEWHRIGLRRKEGARQAGVTGLLGNHFVTGGEGPASVSSRDIDKAGRWIERHGRPVVTAARGGINRHRVLVVERFRIDQGAA